MKELAAYNKAFEEYVERYGKPKPTTLKSYKRQMISKVTRLEKESEKLKKRLEDKDQIIRDKNDKFEQMKHHMNNKIHMIKAEKKANEKTAKDLFMKKIDQLKEKNKILAESEKSYKSRLTKALSKNNTTYTQLAKKENSINSLQTKLGITQSQKLVITKTKMKKPRRSKSKVRPIESDQENNKPTRSQRGRKKVKKSS